MVQSLFGLRRVKRCRREFWLEPLVELAAWLSWRRVAEPEFAARLRIAAGSLATALQRLLIARRRAAAYSTLALQELQPTAVLRREVLLLAA